MPQALPSLAAQTRLRALYLGRCAKLTVPRNRPSYMPAPCPTVPPGLQALPGLNALQSLQTFELGGCWGLKVYSGDTWEPLLPHEIDGGEPSRRARPHRCIKSRHCPTWHRSVRFTRSTWKTALRSKVCPTSRRCRCCNPSRFAYWSSTNASDTVTIKLGECQ